ncbi:hypothetical protein FBU30_009777 [Linnemannia zychae]|nr:hypothetical protein FBU30_009777 [Linnemannia zychae]
MSVVPLSRRRKAELKELASSLGLSEDGVREDLVERIKAHIATSNDHSLRALIREDSPDGTATTVTIYTINNNNSSSGRSSPRKKTTTGVTKETHTSSTSGGVTKGTTTVRRGSNSLSHTEDELEEHEVRKFMDHMHSELSEARDLAKQLEETLHAKFVTNDSSSSHGKGTITETKTSGESRRLSGSSNSRTYLIGGRRGSKDQKSAELSISRHDSGHYSSHFGSEPSPSSHRDNHHESSGKHLLRSRRLHRHDDEDENEDEEGHRRYSKHSGGSFSNQHSGHLHDQRWCSKAFCRLTSGYLDSLCHYVSKPWILLQDIGSTSRGFVWLTMFPQD